jgi:hypothetical protein
MIITIKFQTVQEVGTFSCTSNQFLNKTSRISSLASLAAQLSLIAGRQPLTMCSGTRSVLRSGSFMSWQKLCGTQQLTTIDGAVSTLEFTELRMRHHIFNNPKAFSMLILPPFIYLSNFILSTSPSAGL